MRRRHGLKSLNKPVSLEDAPYQDVVRTRVVALHWLPEDDAGRSASHSSSYKRSPCVEAPPDYQVVLPFVKVEGCLDFVTVLSHVLTEFENLR